MLLLSYFASREHLLNAFQQKIPVPYKALHASVRAHLMLLFETIHKEVLCQDTCFGKCFMTAVLKIATALCLKGLEYVWNTTLSTR